MSDSGKALARAVAAHGAGRFADAAAAYRRILKQQPDHADAHHLLGVALHQQGQNLEAVESIDRAINLSPSQWAYHSNLACVLQKLGRLEEAINSQRRAIALESDRPAPWSNLGSVLHEAGQLDEAAECFEKAIQLDPDNAEAHYNYGNLLREQGSIDDAIARYDRAISLKPGYSEAHSNLGNLLQDKGQLDEAVRSYRWALEVRPNNEEAHYNLARALKGLGRYDEAHECYDRALQLRPDHAAAHVSRGLIFLRRGDFAKGWPEYEWRWKKDDEPSLRQLPQTLWDGSSLDDKTILIYSEQGIGDEIMFGSCLPDLVERAGHCVIECDARLTPLYARSFPAATVHAREGWERHGWLKQVRPIDVQTPVGNLPQFLRLDEASFPARPSFLTADSQKRERWRQRLEALGEGPKIGISWCGQSEYEAQRGRSTTLQQWEPVLTLPGMHFVNLQYGPCSEEIAAVSSRFDVEIHDWEDLDPSVDVDGLAALVSALDLVISIANTTVHLAGALGTEVWSVLSALPSWRWMEDRTDTPWYSSVRLIRQTAEGGWDEQFGRLRDELIARWSPNAGSATARGRRVKVRGAKAKTRKAKQRDVLKKKPALITDRRWDLQDATIDEAAQRALEFHNSKDMVQAEGICREILRHAPQHANALHLLGIIARDSDRPDLAIESMNKAIDVNPAKPGFHFSLSTVLAAQGKSDEAVAELRTALELAPKFPEAYLNLGALLERENRLTEALPYCQRAVELSPKSSHARYNLANVVSHLGRVEEAIGHYEHVIELKPDYPKAHWNLALARLLLCNFAEGWEGYEWREKAKEVIIDQYAEPLWDGSPLEGKTILLHAEQGVGDEIMFGSCFPDVIGQAGRTVISCDPRLASLFARSFPTAQVYGILRRAGRKNIDAEAPEPVDVQIPIGSLPRYLRKSWDSFPRRRQYLIPHAGQREKWRKRFEELGPGLKIGISWRAGGKAKEQLRRTTLLEHWEPLLKVSDVHWINLQYGDCRDDLKSAREQFGVEIHDWDDADPLSDLDEFAAQIAALDMVISVGNTTIHMAGALGVETWTVLPFIPGWRYMLREPEMPWYTSVKLFRQPKPGDWKGVVRKIGELLQQRIRSDWRPLLPPDTSHEDGPVLDAGARADTSHAAARTSHFVDGPTSIGKAADHSPKHAASKRDDELLYVAVKHHRGGDLVRAEKIYRNILEAHPRHAHALHLLGALRHHTGGVDEGVDLMRQAVAEDDSQATFHYNLANALRDQGRRDEAIDHYRRTIEIDRNLAEAHLNLGVLFKDQRKLDEAMACCEGALKARPDYAEAHNNMGSVLADRGRLDQAVACYRRAVQIRPDYADAHLHLGSAFRQLGRVGDALACYDHVLELRADDTEAHIQRAMLRLLKGKFAQGWAEWEYRWQSEQATPRPRLSIPVWKGTPLCDKSLLIYGEQGVGDEIMFASCLPDVVDEAAHCIVQCDSRLEPLFRRSFPSATVVARHGIMDDDQLAKSGKVDLQMAAGSLPRYLRPDVSSFPRQKAYLVPDAEKRKRWRAQLDRLPPGLRVGISWRGGTEHDGVLRTVSLAQWEPLWSISGAQFVNLQYGDCGEELSSVQNGFGVTIHDFDELDTSNDFDSLAALVAELDLVISIANTTVHLAGAVGADVWTLVSFAPSWRWTNGHTDNLWYPSMKLFRQNSPEGWDDVLAELARELSIRRDGNRPRAVPPPKSKAFRKTRGSKRVP